MNIVIALILDVIVVGIIVAAVIIGARRGLVKSIVGIFGHVIALILALIFSVQLGVYLNDHYIREPLRDWVVNQLTANPETEETHVSEIDLDGLFENMPSFFTDMVKYLGLDVSELAEDYESFKTSGIEQAKAAIVDLMVDPLSEVVSRVLAFFAIYLLALIAVRILWYLSDLIAKIPVIRTFNAAGGALIGLVTGVLIVFVFVSIAHLTSPYVLKDKPISERTDIYNRTVIYRSVNDINPLTHIFGQWFTTEPVPVDSGAAELS